jgi:hypothetical protein
VSIVVVAAASGDDTVVEVLRSVTNIELATVPEPAGRAELDPVLDGLAGRRLVVAGPAALLGDVLGRLLRRDELAATPVGVVAGPDLEAQARLVVGGVPVPADLVRDDHGGVLVERAELAPWQGRRLGLRAYADDVRVADGEVGGFTVEPTGDGALRAKARPARRWGADRAAAGRAVQVSCDEARLVVDGRSHPRPVIRRTWWVEPGGWLRLDSQGPI